MNRINWIIIFPHFPEASAGDCGGDLTAGADRGNGIGQRRFYPEADRRSSPGRFFSLAGHSRTRARGPVYPFAVVGQPRIGPGDIQRLSETARWLLTSMGALAKVLRIRADRTRFINDLELRVQHGCKRELLPLVQIPQIGRHRARMLFRYGFKSLPHLREADPVALLNVPGIGPELIERIKRYAESDGSPDLAEEPPEMVLPEPEQDKLAIQKTLSEFLDS